MSYMDDKNIVSEGVFDMLMKKLNLDKKIKKNPKVKKTAKELEKSVKDLEKSVNALLKRRGLKPTKI